MEGVSPHVHRSGEILFGESDRSTAIKAVLCDLRYEEIVPYEIDLLKDSLRE